MKILAISGSLRRVSSNVTLLHAAATLAPHDMEIILFGGLGDLPHFNPDLEGVEPASVLDFRASLQASDGVLISSPEYAHGVPGALKNALDWVVGSGELVAKPVALWNASPRSTYAQASLMEILTTMDARLVAEACIAVPVSGSKLDVEGIAAHVEISPILRTALLALAQAIDKEVTGRI